MSTNKPIICILAVDNNLGIAVETKDENGNIISHTPWHIKEEMKMFKDQTLAVCDNKKKNATILGRRSYDEIPKKFRPLAGRLNIVITSEQREDTEDLKHFKSSQEALSYLNTRDDIENIFIYVFVRN